ncbi:SMI1/KNR4 family protein [Streptomyces sp. DSM 41972]|uniref:SMI1/KNR4 family protein n=1 Tax=Streptomyces althioticus subsp. attaecolombicae TaxID=3075534 RepID=A0ABU3HSH3_9ACTN|nr:SMI1/KNR4 family protein [Streptomyces sp. DSM 41972]SCD40725.1 SMI1 / KNR4 family (SUKH-1) [Streptomyces sp. di50b]SCD94351.1 SMI1 / KNR4 family (SUKH-1) [Streptomyces sp. di188]
MREILAGASAECSAPVDAAARREAERRLGRAVPARLGALLRDTDGVVDAYGTEVVWPLARIAGQNLLSWSGEGLRESHMPFGSLLFFGDNGGGDQFALVVAPERDDVFVWDHETDSRVWVAGSIDAYLRRALAEGAAGDWWR